MGSYSLSPFAFQVGTKLSGHEECALERWIALNAAVLQDYWDGAIEYTEDALALLRPV